MDFAELVYESMAGHIIKGFGVPGVEDAFAEGSHCMTHYNQMRDAYDRLCDRLGAVDEDEDVEQILYHLDCIQTELCRRMFYYGVNFGKNPPG